MLSEFVFSRYSCSLQRNTSTFIKLSQAFVPRKVASA